MRLFLFLCILVSLAITVDDLGQFPIKHWIVLMMENRSFDHLLGHLKKTNPEIEGLFGNESNPYDPSDPNSERVYVNFDAPNIDPNADHSVEGTTLQIFGSPHENRTGIPPMNGFVKSAEGHTKGWGPKVMSTFNSKTLPILSTLAQEYLLMDRWFSSVPGPTEVNRAFVNSATSNGIADNDIPTLEWGFPQDCVQPMISEAGYSWGVFFEFFPTAFFMRQLRSWPGHFHSFWQFENLCASGELPTYSFLEPRYYSITEWYPANDQHPDHNVEAGEELIKWVYEMVRASPAWNQTALIITYDEHGGMYDHFPTPLEGVPNPDGKSSTDPQFGFDRLGVRVPTVIVSPWVNKGSVVHDPTGPTRTSRYEHSSIIATLTKVLGLKKHLTKRDAWAGTFEHVFMNRTSARTDCPVTLPETHKVLLRKDLTKQPMNDLQKNMVAVAAHLNDLKAADVLPTLTTEQEGGKFVAEMMERFLARSRPNTDAKH